MPLRLKSIARYFFKKDKRTQSRVLPSTKSPVKLPRRQASSSRNSDTTNDATMPDNSTGTPPLSLSDTRPSDSNDKVKQKPLCCDKCDGKHETDLCPYYKTKRGSHPDELKNFYKKMGGVSHLPGQTLRSARVVRQPGDGSCLFHSMSHGMTGTSAASLRSQICAFIGKNPNLLIADTPLSDWVKWDSRGSVGSYVLKMSSGAWGGGIEMACMSLLKNCNVHVYERSRLGYTRISAFDHPSRPEDKRTVKVLYCGGIHYDALV